MHVQDRSGPDFRAVYPAFRNGNRQVSHLLLLLVILLAAWGAVQCAPAAGTARRQPDQEQGVLRATLDNGLRVVIVRNTLSPVVTTIVNYLVGSDEAPQGFPGTAHAVEHMMFRGSSELSAGQLANVTAAMGGDFNADTRQHVTRYFFTVPSEDLETALRIESGRMRGILESEELWTQERGAMDQEAAQAYSSPEYIFYTRLLKAMFKDTPYENDALGSRPSFQKTTASMLKGFHGTWYVPNNAILVIVGDVNPKDALALVERFFKDIPERKVPERPQVDLKPLVPETISLKTDKPYGMVFDVFRMPGYDSPDYAAAQILSDVLGSRRGSLYSLVPEGKALETEFDISTLPKAGLGFAVGVFPEGADTGKLREGMHTALFSTVKEGVSPDLVEAAKRRRVTDLELAKNSVTGLAMEWSRAIAVMGKKSPADLADEIKKVSVADVNRVARKYILAGNSITAVLTPEHSGNPVQSKGFGGIESFTPKDIKPVPLPEWAQKSVRKLSIPRSALNPEVRILKNGIKLIVQPESVSNTVSVYGQIRTKPEMAVPPGKEGVQDVLEELFSFGTASKDRVAYLKAVDDIGAYSSAGSNFSLRVLADHFEQGVALLAENEIRPALPADAFETIRRQAAAAAVGRLKSAEFLSDQAVKKALFPPKDPTLRHATPTSLTALKIEDVKAYYSKAFRPDLSTIVVIGNISPSRAGSTIEKYFGGWKAPDTPKPEVVLPPVRLNGPSTIAIPNASRVQDNVILAETLGLTRSHPDYYALQLGNHVLGGAFYATRLYRDLREQTGLVYYVSSTFDMSRTRGVYSVEYGCDPPNVKKARAIVEHNLKAMQKNPVSGDELQRAKSLLLRMIPLAESSVDAIALGFLKRTELELPLDEPTRAAQRYAKLTAEEVKNAYAKWVRPGDLIQVTEGPKP